MSYKKEATTKNWNLRPDETPDRARNRQPDSTTERWTITVNEREWTLTATRYHDADGTESRAFWRINETGANRHDHDGDVEIQQGWKDDKATTGVNWPCRGTQPAKEVARFVSDLSASNGQALTADDREAIEAAQEYCEILADADDDESESDKWSATKTAKALEQILAKTK